MSQLFRSLNKWVFISFGLIVIGTISHALFGHSWISTSGHAVGSDDAYISFRYAENFFYGNGLVFNPGDRVEGYSNFLYTLMIVPAFLLGKNWVYVYSVCFNCFLLAAVLYGFWNYCRNRYDVHFANRGVLILGLNPWIWANAATGLETILVLYGITGLWVSADERVKRGSNKSLFAVFVFSALTIFSRVDGFILPLVLVLFWLASKNRRDGFGLLLFVLFCVGFHTLFRWYYYGDLMANTYYNKVSGGVIQRLTRGFAFLCENLMKTGVFSAAASIFLMFFYRAKTRLLGPGVGISLVFLLVWLLYLLYIGGDIYYERFLVPLIPCVVLIFLSGISGFGRFVNRLMVVFFICSCFLGVRGDGRFQWSVRKYDMWIELGKYLEPSSNDSLLAIDAAGKVPFFSGLRTLDMLGLNDRHIGKMTNVTSGAPGHEKFDPDYVLSRRPTFIAAWISPNMDMAWGLGLEKYGKMYSLRYLVNSTREHLGKANIVDVSFLEPAAIQALIRSGYSYGVLHRKKI